MNDETKDAPAQVERTAKAIHYPECWDTAAYPTLESALDEIASGFHCTNQDTHAPAARGDVGITISNGWHSIAEQLPEIPDSARGARIHVLAGRYVGDVWFSWSAWYGRNPEGGGGLCFYEEWIGPDEDGHAVELYEIDDCARYWQHMPAGPNL